MIDILATAKKNAGEDSNSAALPEYDLKADNEAKQEDTIKQYEKRRGAPSVGLAPGGSVFEGPMLKKRTQL